jgi:hypothetical protein
MAAAGGGDDLFESVHALEATFIEEGAADGRR